MTSAEFLNLLREKAEKTVHTVTQKSGKLVDVTKLNYAIGMEEAELKKKYERIGRMVFEAKNGEGELSDEINTLCDDISLSLEKIADLKAQVQTIKNKKNCPHCGSEMQADAKFCPSCGCKTDGRE